jgi:hypothetical protein
VAEYQYRCAGCGRLFASGERADVTRCPDCSQSATRVFAFYTSSSMREHWNTAVGQYVSNSQDMDRALKTKGEEMSVRTGIAHEYEYLSPAEMADPTATGADPNLLEETHRRQRDQP